MPEGRGLDLSRIGAILKRARDERHLELAVIAEALFIRKSTLAAIEDGRWNMLPHEVYVKGYVRSYAAYLGITDKLEAELRRFSASAP